MTHILLNSGTEASLKNIRFSMIKRFDRIQLYTNFVLIRTRFIVPEKLVWVCPVCCLMQKEATTYFTAWLGEEIAEWKWNTVHCYHDRCSITVLLKCVQYYRWLTEQRCLAWTLWQVLVEWRTALPANVTPFLHHCWVCKCMSRVDKDTRTLTGSCSVNV